MMFLKDLNNLVWSFDFKFQFISEMCNRLRLVIDLVIDYAFFQSNRNRNRSFLQNSNRNRNRNPVKKNCV